MPPGFADCGCWRMTGLVDDRYFADCRCWLTAGVWRTTGISRIAGVSWTVGLADNGNDAIEDGNAGNDDADEGFVCVFHVGDYTG